MLLLSTIALQGMAHSFAIISEQNIYLQIILSSSVVLLFVLLGNLYIPFYKLHYIYQYVANFSVVRYCYEAMMILQYGFGRCGPKEIQATLHMMQINDDHFYTCIVMIIFNLVLNRVIAIGLLVYKSNPANNEHSHREIIKARAEKLNPQHAIIAGLSCSQEFRIKSGYN